MMKNVEFVGNNFNFYNKELNQKFSRKTKTQDIDI